jgi:hypothetical protein
MSAVWCMRCRAWVSPRNECRCQLLRAGSSSEAFYSQLVGALFLCEQHDQTDLPALSAGHHFSQAGRPSQSSGMSGASFQFGRTSKFLIGQALKSPAEGHSAGLARATSRLRPSGRRRVRETPSSRGKNLSSHDRHSLALASVIGVCTCTQNFVSNSQQQPQSRSMV